MASSEKPAVDVFFQQYGDHTCVLNGIGVRSLAHDTCLRLISAEPVLIGATIGPASLPQSVNSPMIPQVVLSGPSYAADLSSYIRRVGETGQIGSIIGNNVICTFGTGCLRRCMVERSSCSQRNGKSPTSLPQATSNDCGRRSANSAGHGQYSGFDERCIRRSGQYLARDLSNAVQLLSNGTARCVSLKHRGWQKSAMTLMLPLLFKQAIFSNPVR